MDATDSAIDKKAWIALGIVSLAVYMSVVDASAVNVAFPSVRRDLETSRATLSWMISAYTITTASLLLIAGHLADALGRKRVFATALSVFILGSAIAGLADSFEVLIIGRVIQGAGTAGVLPSSLALILPLFPKERRSTAVGIWGSMATAGAATGPTVGALLIDASSWRAIFWINVPIGIFAVTMTILRVPESRGADRETGRLDPLGVPMVTAGVALVMLAIVQSDTWGITDARVIALAMLGLALLPAAIFRSRSHPRPAIDLSLFAIRTFGPASIALALYGAGFLAGFLSTTLYVQELWQFGVLKTGLALSPGPIVATFVGMYSGRLAERVGHRLPIVIGTACMGGCYLYLAVAASAQPDYFGRYLIANLLLGLGLGLSLANITGYALSEVDQLRYAIAGASIRTVQQIASAFGIAVMVTLLGSDAVTVSDFRRGWAWVVAMFVGSCLVALTTFRRGAPASTLSE